MTNLLLRLAIIAGVLLVIAVAAVVVVLAAAGLGSLLAAFLPFSLFEATLLSLITLISLGVLLWQIVALVMRSGPPTSIGDDEEDQEEDWDDEEDWDYDEFEDEDDEQDESPSAPFIIPAMPRRQPSTGQIRFEKVGRNDPCPCGSGKKYKNCHGKPQTAN